VHLEAVSRCFNLLHNFHIYLSFFVISYFKSIRFTLNNISTGCNKPNFNYLVVNNIYLFESFFHG
jgi:hypothetical protein